MLRGVIWTMFAIWTEMAWIEPVSVGRSHLHRLFEKDGCRQVVFFLERNEWRAPRRLEPADFHLTLPFDRGRPAAYFRIGLSGLRLQQLA
ncbi:hypothetical protein ATB98_03415 [Sinorhizobium saheli]|uniref:Uncharacterized protein n=1 Tax=Sinorhizobium saheli TaxID=36856 RepID=A0A178YSS2_SINSA|nr:hypothetical protein ATB98_03415 [Sinorhizobium saheli]